MVLPASTGSLAASPVERPDRDHTAAHAFADVVLRLALEAELDPVV
jgi:hypothetical protein